MAAPRARIPVIIDTDPGVDDVIAILLAIASPELEILAYNVSYGNTDLEASYLNILKVYQTIERHLEQYPEHKARFPNFDAKNKPVLVKGTAGPLEGGLHSAQYFHGRDGLGDIADLHPELALQADLNLHRYLEISDKSGIEVSLDILRSQPARSVTYIALGPLTNLALLMRADNQLVEDRIGRIVCMGGALDVPGNTSPLAEFNFFADPFAVKELLISTELHKGLPLDRFIMLPLDITTPHELPFPIYKKCVDPAFDNAKLPSIGGDKPPVTHFTSSFLEKTREVMISFGKDAMELHDIVAVWCAIENPPFADEATDVLAPGWQRVPRVFDVERTGELTRGMLVVDRREDESAYPIGTNRSEAQREPHDHSHVPGGIEVQKVGQAVNKDLSGVYCVSKTPGPAALLEFLLKRIWGCSLGA